MTRPPAVTQFQAFFDLFKCKDLVYVLVKSRLKQKYVGSLLGYFWSFYTALFPLVSYVFVFFFIAKVDVAGVEGPWQYLLFVFSGLVPWLFFSKVTVEAVDSFNANLEVIRQAIFPIEVLGIVLTTEHLIGLILQVALLVVILAFAGDIWTVRLLLLVPYFLVLYGFCLGLAWFLSVLGFMIRDFKDIITSFVQFLIYLTPVMYRVENIPSKARFLFQLNPMTHGINILRDIVYNPTIEHPESILYFSCISAVVFLLGYICIFSVKKEVGDLI